MRPKIVILILVAELAGLTVIFFIKHQVSPPRAAAPTAITETVPAAVQTAPTITSIPPPAPVHIAVAPVAAEPAATNAIPTLEALAANTTDLAEQSALLEAAHFISLPSIFDTTM
ncbi:MAG: hypothetical protein ABSA45_12750, partial [Verrucomicrobiota bacterium]